MLPGLIVVAPDEHKKFLQNLVWVHEEVISPILNLFDGSLAQIDLLASVRQNSSHWFVAPLVKQNWLQNFPNFCL